MAWRCSGHTNTELVQNLLSANLINSEGVSAAMNLIDRGNYAPDTRQAYEDSPQRIGHGATISAPHMHAHALELLEPHMPLGAKVLDVGCGSGYLTACMARMVGPEGRVFGIDYIEPLVALTQGNIMKADGELLDGGIVELSVGDGWAGIPAEAPFDAIHVGAAAASMPQALLEQLKVGGRMIIPVGPDGGAQYLMQVDRVSGGTDKSDFRVQNLMGVRYVPLVNVAERR